MDEKAALLDRQAQLLDRQQTQAQQALAGEGTSAEYTKRVSAKASGTDRD